MPWHLSYKLSYLAISRTKTFKTTNSPRDILRQNQASISSIPGTPKLPATTDTITRADYSDPAYNFCQIVVPDVPEVKAAILHACHDTTYSGHRGKFATKLLVAKDFYWHGLDKYVDEYVHTCPICQKTKTSTLPAAGKLKPLSIPMRRGSHYSIDQIVSLPTTKNGFDAILVIVDRLTKYTHYIPCHTNDTAEKLALLFFQRVGVTSLGHP